MSDDHARRRVVPPAALPIKPVCNTVTATGTTHSKSSYRTEYALRGFEVRIVGALFEKR